MQRLSINLDIQQHDNTVTRKFAKTLYKIFFLYASIVLTLLCSCTGKAPRYHIGVSQCSEDIWRDKLNREISMGTYFYDDIEFSFASADDSDEKQIEQIEEFIRQGVDLLIVAPNQMSTVSPVIGRAYDNGIPVIVFDRKTISNKYTAYIGADNYDMGRQMGRYIASQLNGHGTVIEVMGLKGSSPAIERHNGFLEALREYPDIKLAASLQGDWTEESAIRALKEYKGDLKGIDYVFGQNDRMAIGARKVISQHQKPLTAKFCGIDALPGKGGGIDCVQRKLLEASYVYPTRGDMVVQLAMAILTGQPYKRENPMKSAIVNKDNATVMLMQVEEMNTQASLLKELHGRVDSYLSQYHHQQIYTLLAAIIALTVIAASLYIIISMRRRQEMEREAYEIATSSSPSPQESMATAGSQQPLPNTSDPSPSTQQRGSDSGYLHQASAGEMENGQLPDGARLPFLERLRMQIHENLNDSDYSVEQLASDMGLSRAQLYRKVKVLTGRTPVDVIRLNRLNRAKYLLTASDMTVSEIAYAVGFTAPSYFTKCFKDEFGVSPTASIQRNQNT